MPVLICKGDHYVNVKGHLRVRVADLRKYEDEGLLSSVLPDAGDLCQIAV